MVTVSVSQIRQLFSHFLFSLCEKDEFRKTELNVLAGVEGQWLKTWRDSFPGVGLITRTIGIVAGFASGLQCNESMNFFCSETDLGRLG